MIALSSGRLAGAVAAEQAEHLAARAARGEAPAAPGRGRSRQSRPLIERVSHQPSPRDRRPGRPGRRGSRRACPRPGSRPKSSTVIRSARSMTTAMLCSISSTVASAAMLAHQRLEGVDLAIRRAPGSARRGSAAAASAPGPWRSPAAAGGRRRGRRRASSAAPRARCARARRPRRAGGRRASAGGRRPAVEQRTLRRPARRCR